MRQAEILKIALADRDGWVERWPDTAAAGDRLVARGLFRHGRKPDDRLRVTATAPPGFFITDAGTAAASG